jgi:putative DNA primase/helicase
MQDAFARIVAIVDAAGPAEAPAIPADPGKKVAPRKRRARSSVAAAAPAAAAGGDHPSRPPSDPSAAAAPAPAALAVSAEEKNASSQKGGLPAEQSGNLKTADGGGGDDEPPDDGDDEFGRDDDLNRKLAFYPQTDLGNAERFRERYRGKLLWCPALGWLWWDGKRWSRHGAEEKVKTAEHETVRAIQAEAAAIRGTARDELLGIKKILGVEHTWHVSDALAAWGRQAEYVKHLSQIAKRAAPYLFVATEQLDADPMKFNVANGTLIFRKTAVGDFFEFKKHNPRDYITKISAVEYDKDARCPLFDEFFSFAQPDEGMRRFIMQWQGYSLTGDATEQKLAVFWGGGKNGKSTLVDVCAFIGGDYSETVPIETFLNEGRMRNAGQATPDLALLPGVRHLRTSEPNRGAKLDEALIKVVTGGERVMCRHLNKEFFGFYPQFKLTISGQHRPDIRGADEGIWRRMQLVPWLVTVPKEKRDLQLGAKLRAEASGIMNRLLEGLRDYLEHGLIEPAAVTEATADYRRDSDPLGRFLEACVVHEAGGRVQSSYLHEVYCAWAKANGATEWSNKGLSNALKERQFVSKHSGVMWWLNIKLTASVNDFIDHLGKPLRKTANGDAESPAVVNSAGNGDEVRV